MKRILSIAALSLGIWLCVFPCSAASVPVRDMSALSLGAEYYGALYGHYALYDFDSSALAAHLFRLHYSPAPWLRLTGGVGGAYAYATPSVKGAEAGLALTGGVGFYTPKLFRWLSLTAGYDYIGMAAKEKSAVYKTRAVPLLDPATGAAVGFDTVRYAGSVTDGSTAAFIHALGAGVIFHLGRFADCEIGGVYHIFNVAKKERTVLNTDYDDEGEPVTATVRKSIGDGGESADQVRLYAAVTLHDRESGAFVAGGAGYALTNSAENDKTILPNFSFWWQAGLIMRDPRDGAPRHGRRDAAYAGLKIREERMAEALRRDAERAEPRRRYGGERDQADKRAPPEAAAESGGDGAAETEPGAGDADAEANEE